MSKHAKKLAKNTLFSLGSAFSDVLLLLLFIFAGRVLTVPEFGELTFGLAVGFIVALALDLGLNAHVEREVAIDRSRLAKLLYPTLFWKMGIGLGLYIPIALIAQIFFETQSAFHLFLVFAASGITRALLIAVRSYVRGLEAFATETALVVGDRVCIILLGCLVLIYAPDPFNLGLLLIASRLLLSLIGLAILHARVKPEVTLAPRRVLTHQRLALPFAVGGILSAVYLPLDVFLLNSFSTDYEVGIFGASYRFFEGFLMVATVLAQAFYPRLSALYEESRDEYRHYAFKLLSLMSLLAAALVIVVYSQAEFIIKLFYGSAYLESVSILKIIAIVSALFMVFHASIIVQRAAGQQNIIVGFFVLGLLVKLGLGSWLAANYGSVGAAFGLLVSMFAMFIFSLVMCAKSIDCQVRYWRFLASISLVAGCVMLLMLILHQGFALNLSGFVQIPLLLIVYVVLLRLFRVFDMVSELKMLLASKSS